MATLVTYGQLPDVRPLVGRKRDAFFVEHLRGLLQKELFFFLTQLGHKHLGTRPHHEHSSDEKARTGSTIPAPLLLVDVQLSGAKTVVGARVVLCEISPRLEGELDHCAQGSHGNTGDEYSLQGPPEHKIVAFPQSEWRCAYSLNTQAHYEPRDQRESNRAPSNDAVQDGIDNQRQFEIVHQLLPAHRTELDFEVVTGVLGVIVKLLQIHPRLHNDLLLLSFLEIMDEELDSTWKPGRAGLESCLDSDQVIATDLLSELVILL
mmetsp:Transcript_71683/g.135403  ORF Transcript_71683/g.135403 Transcript_71683/m.135403 type:complete len:263 (+) Transcript_71683:1605-2393(+)